MPAWWDVTWATWTLVVVGGLAALAALLTLRAINRQTKVAEDAARAAKANSEAALLQAQALINSERPWLVVTHRNPKPEYFVFDIKNVGRTPAEIVSVRPQFTVQDPSIEALPPGALNEVTLYHRQLLPPMESWESFWDFNVFATFPENDKIRTLINKNVQRIIFYGTIRYVAPIDDKVTHETSYCFWFNPVTKSLVVGGPDGANKHT